MILVQPLVAVVVANYEAISFNYLRRGDQESIISQVLVTMMVMIVVAVYQYP